MSVRRLSCAKFHTSSRWHARSALDPRECELRCIRGKKPYLGIALWSKGLDYCAHRPQQPVDASDRLVNSGRGYDRRSCLARFSCVPISISWVARWKQFTGFCVWSSHRIEHHIRVSVLAAQVGKIAGLVDWSIPNLAALAYLVGTIECSADDPAY